MSLDKIVNEINKKFGEGTIYKASEIVDRALNGTSIQRIPTGSLALDIVTNGGWPRGRVSEIYGAPGCGKTTLTFFAIAQAQKDPEARCVFFDCEDSFDHYNLDYITNCGVDLERLTVVPTSKAERVFDIAKKLLQSDTPPDLIIIDSVAAMMPTEDLEKEIETPTMATRARVLARGLGVVNAVNKQTAVILINQLRSNLSPYGAPTTSPGGFALKHVVSLKIEIKMGEPITESKRRVGHVIKYKATKSKVGVPYRDGASRFLYFLDGQEGGIDRVDESLNIGIANDVIVRAGAWYEFEGVRVQGKEAMYEALKEDKKLLDKLEKQLNA